MDYKLELIPLPVADVDRAKAFYRDQCGFDVDLDHAPNDDFRIVQLTPPGSGCSIMVGKGTIEMMVFDTVQRTAHLSRGAEYGVAWKDYRFISRTSG